jgi:hypothetical protein
MGGARRGYRLVVGDFIMKSAITVILAGLLTIAPQLLPLVPEQYKVLASGIIATLAALYHLYQPAPSEPAVIAPQGAK